MSQVRSRRTSARAPEVRPAGSGARASGDGGGVQANRRRQEFKTGNKIPKSIRYDLENALLGLCDVWFEDIKPYLMRNNIKLHVEGLAESESVGGGQRTQRSPAPACGHRDPASSATECKLCRLLFNAANSIESAVSQASAAAPSPGLASDAP